MSQSWHNATTSVDTEPTKPILHKPRVNIHCVSRMPNTPSTTCIPDVRFTQNFPFAEKSTTELGQFQKRFNKFVVLCSRTLISS